MSNLSAKLEVRLEPQHRDKFAKMAKARGFKKASDFHRALILAILGEEVIEAAAQPDPEDAAPDRMTIRLPAFLKKAASARAKSRGMSPSRWVSALVQSNLTDQPVMSPDELAALKASTRELAAVGRNINQIARAINEAFMAKSMTEAFNQAERVRLDALGELRQVIDANQATVRALIRASQQAWKVDE